MTLTSNTSTSHFPDGAWTAVCDVDDIAPNSGVCVTVAGRQIAVFRLSSAGLEDRMYAISNYDPYARAFIMSRGIVGRSHDVVRVVSPLLKHTFDLASGRSLEHEGVALPTFEVRPSEGRVWLRVP